MILIGEILGGKLNKINLGNRKGGKNERKRKIEGGAGVKKLISEIEKGRGGEGVTRAFYIRNVFCDNRVLR